MKKIINLGIIALTILVLSGCKTKDESSIVVLTSTPYEPFEMIDHNGDYIGFDIELMEALAKEAGLTIEWKDVSFNGIIASLQSGQYDIAIAGLNPTQARSEVVDFSHIYYNSEDGLTNYLVTLSETSVGLGDLDGLVVGAQLGTIQAEILTSLQETYNFTVELRNSNAQILEEIKLGTIDALLVEAVISGSIIEANNDFNAYIFDVELEELYGYAIAFSPNSPYKDIFNDALQTLKDNGTLDALIEKWFS